MDTIGLPWSSGALFSINPGQDQHLENVRRKTAYTGVSTGGVSEHDDTELIVAIEVHHCGITGHTATMPQPGKITAPLRHESKPVSDVHVRGSCHDTRIRAVETRVWKHAIRSLAELKGDKSTEIIYRGEHTTDGQPVTSAVP